MADIHQFIKVEFKRFNKINMPTVHDATTTEIALDEVELQWSFEESRLALVPGKDALSYINKELQLKYGISITTTAIIDSMQENEVPQEMTDLIHLVAKFAAEKIAA